MSASFAVRIVMNFSLCNRSTLSDPNCGPVTPLTGPQFETNIRPSIPAVGSSTARPLGEGVVNSGTSRNLSLRVVS